jgi:hypothetical protein
LRETAINGDFAGGHETAVRRRQESRRRRDLRWFGHALERSHGSKHLLTTEDLDSGVAHLTARARYVAIGEDFVRFGLANRETIQVRWSAVDTYELRDSGNIENGGRGHPEANS